MRRTILIPAAIAAFALSACGSDSGSSSTGEIKKLLNAEMQKQMTDDDAFLQNMPKEIQTDFKGLVTEMASCAADAMSDNDVTVAEVRELIDAGAFGGESDNDEIAKEILSKSKFEAVDKAADKCSDDLEKKFENIMSDVGSD